MIKLKVYIPFYFNLIYLRDLRKIKSIFGNFEHLDKSELKKNTLIFKNESRNVSGFIIPEIIKIIFDLKYEIKNILLDGDNKSIIEQFKNKFNFNSRTKILTTGIDGDFDYIWNFENDYPNNIPNDFDLIVSQAILEHLINPYKHFCDLSKLLKPKGFLIIHSVMPGFIYHRFPIDTVRFFPDWFEYSASKMNLKIKRKFIRDFNIIYLLEK